MSGRVKERFHNAVEIEILGIFWGVFIVTNFGPPKKKFSGAKLFRAKHRARALFLAGVEFHVLPYVLVCFLVEFDLLFAFSVSFLSNSGLCSASLSIYVPEHDRLCFPIKQLYLNSFVDLVPVATEKVSLVRSNNVWNRKSALSARPEPRKGNVNTVYFVN